MLFTLNALFLALMSLLDFSLEKFPNGEVAFSMIFVLRALQGVTIGLSFVIVQVCFKPFSVGATISFNTQNFDDT